MQPVEVPVVELPLGMPAGLDGVPGLGFLDDRLRLTALDPPAEKLVAPRGCIELRFRNPRSQSHCAPRGRARLLKTCHPIRQFPAAGRGDDQPPPSASPLGGGRQRMFQASLLAQGGLKRKPALFFFKLPDA
jgi:hypothetical protein